MNIKCHVSDEQALPPAFHLPIAALLPVCAYCFICGCWQERDNGKGKGKKEKKPKLANGFSCAVRKSFLWETKGWPMVFLAILALSNLLYMFCFVFVKPLVSLCFDLILWYTCTRFSSFILHFLYSGVSVVREGFWRVIKLVLCVSLLLSVFHFLRVALISWFLILH